MVAERGMTIRPDKKMRERIEKYREAKSISTWTGALFALVNAGITAESRKESESTK